MIREVLISVQVLGAESVENNHFLGSLGPWRCRNTITQWRGFIAQKKGVLSRTTVETRLEQWWKFVVICMKVSEKTCSKKWIVI